MPRSIATNRYVEEAELIEFIRPRHNAVLMTSRADGSPQLSPVTMGVDDSGRIVIASYPERAKTVNLRRNSQAAVCVLSEDFGGEWIQVGGKAQVVNVPEAVDGLVEYFRNIAGEHPDWEEYRQAMIDQGKVLIRITIDRWGPIAKGGFPARLAG